MKYCVLLWMAWCFATQFMQGQNDEQALYPILWYNTENLFDCEDDSATIDEQFTPDGDKHWNSSRYWYKVKNLSKAILALTEWDAPALIGLCEVENEHVLNDLVYNSPLEELKLSYVHKNSPDPRGIDVALLYNPALFTPLHTEFIPVKGDASSRWVSRDILYCKGRLKGGDTLHVFVNHWPSKYGGAVSSEPRRRHAAGVVRHKTDSIADKNLHANVVLMGDFNETADEPALVHLSQKPLHLLSLNGYNTGTHKYRGNWSQIDYFLVSGTLLQNRKGGLQVQHWKVGDMPFLLEPDPAYSGSKPYRTYIGFRYNGGFSDHLPLVLYLGKK